MCHLFGKQITCKYCLKHWLNWNCIFFKHWYYWFVRNLWHDHGTCSLVASRSAQRKWIYEFSSIDSNTAALYLIWGHHHNIASADKGKNREMKIGNEAKSDSVGSTKKEPFHMKRNDLASSRPVHKYPIHKFFCCKIGTGPELSALFRCCNYPHKAKKKKKIMLPSPDRP